MGPRTEQAEAEPARVSRNVYILGIVSFFTDLSTEMIYPLLPVFITSVLGASTTVLGAIEGAAESASSLLKVVFGGLADRTRRRKPFVLAGYGLSSAAKPLMALAAAPWHVLAVRLADRTGKGVRTAPRDALIADSSPAALRGRAFGLQRTMDHAGAVCGPLIAAALLSGLGASYRLVFALSAIPGALCVLVLFASVRELPRQPAPAHTHGPAAGHSAPMPRRLWVYLGIVFLFTLGNSSDAFLLLRAADLGLSAAAIPIAWVVLHIAKMVTSLPGGMLSDRIGRGSTIVLGWLVYAATYAGFAYASSPGHAWALFAVYGLYFGLTEGTEKAFVADLAPASARGRAFGWFNGAIGIGALPASLLMGAAWHRCGPATAFLLGACIALAAAVLLLALVGRGQPADGGAPMAGYAPTSPKS